MRVIIIFRRLHIRSSGWKQTNNSDDDDDGALVAQNKSVMDGPPAPMVKNKSNDRIASFDF